MIVLLCELVVGLVTWLFCCCDLIVVVVTWLFCCCDLVVVVALFVERYICSCIAQLLFECNDPVSWFIVSK